MVSVVSVGQLLSAVHSLCQAASSVGAKKSDPPYHTSLAADVVSVGAVVIWFFSVCVLVTVSVITGIVVVVVD